MTDAVQLRPFMPAWLDELGLTPAEFRVLLHLWRWARTKTGVKPCTSTAMTIQRTCKISEPTVWKALRALEAVGLVRRVKRFQEPNEYHVQLPVPITQKETVIDPLKSAGVSLPKTEGQLIPKSTMRRGYEKSGKRTKGGEGTPTSILPQMLSDTETETAAQKLDLPTESIAPLFEQYRHHPAGRFVMKDHPGLVRAQVLTVFLSFLQHDSRGKKLMLEAHPIPQRQRDYSRL